MHDSYIGNTSDKKNSAYLKFTEAAQTGSVTGKDISALIKRDFGFDVDKRKIVTKSDIKSFGTFTAEARLFTGIVAQFSVKVEEE